LSQAETRAERTVALLSDNYFRSDFTPGEWTARYARNPAMHEDRLIPVVVGPLSRRTCSTRSSMPTCSPAAVTRCVPDSPPRDALDRRVIPREDTSASITCDEVVTSQTTQLTSQP
jgi:hypothetical protein